MAKLIGNAPNQVPTNADLGSMAFEDKKNYATTSSSIHQPYRNLIINGDMSISQRATSVTGLTSAGYKALDRFEIGAYNLSSAVYRIDQSTDAPTGFYNSLKLQTTTANGTQNANEQFLVEQQIEAQNIYNLDFYTATADSVTISFHIKTNNTGTYPVGLKLSDNNSAHDNTSTRVYYTTYTVNSANTWEKKNITIQLDTSTSKTRPTGNNFGMSLILWFSAGSSRDGSTANAWINNGNACTLADNLNFLGSTSNEVYLTGVQIEKGTTASDFEFLPHDVNLGRCQRYYYLHLDGSNQHLSLGAMYSSDYLVAEVSFPVKMRSQPSLVHTTGTDYYLFYRDSTSDAFNNWSEGIPRTTQNSANLETSLNVSGTAGHAGIIAGNNSASLIAFNSEL